MHLPVKKGYKHGFGAPRKFLSSFASWLVVMPLISIVAVVGSASSANAAASITRNIGTGSVTWDMSDFWINEVTTVEPSNSSYASATHYDAYDGMHYVGVAPDAVQTPIGTYSQFTGVGSWDATSGLYTTNASTINGLSVNVSHKISATHGAGRALITLTNSSSSAVSRSIRYSGNLGSDGGTYVKYTNNSASRTPAANISFNTAATDTNWVISSDNSGVDPAGRGSDPVVSYVYGTANSQASTAYQMSGDNTYEAWNVTVPANSSRIVMVVYGVGEVDSTKNSLGGAYDGVKNNLETFNKLPADLKSDLTQNQTVTTNERALVRQKQQAKLTFFPNLRLS